MQSHSSQEVSLLIAYHNELDISECITNKNINRNINDMINTKFLQRQNSTRFKNYLCDIYSMDEYV